jgi:hypothetical protein
LEAALNFSSGQANDFDFEAHLLDADLWDDRGFGLHFVRIVYLAVLVAVEVALGAEHTRAVLVVAEKVASRGLLAPSLARRILFFSRSRVSEAVVFAAVVVGTVAKVGVVVAAAQS